MGWNGLDREGLIACGWCGGDLHSVDESFHRIEGLLLSELMKFFRLAALLAIFFVPFETGAVTNVIGPGGTLVAWGDLMSPLSSRERILRRLPQGETTFWR